MPVWAWILLAAGGAGAVAIAAKAAGVIGAPEEIYFTSAEDAFYYADEQLRAALAAQGVTIPTGGTETSPFGPGGHPLSEGGDFGDALSGLGGEVLDFLESLNPFS